MTFCKNKIKRSSFMEFVPSRRFSWQISHSNCDYFFARDFRVLRRLRRICDILNYVIQICNLHSKKKFQPVSEVRNENEISILPNIPFWEMHSSSGSSRIGRIRRNKFFFEAKKSCEGLRQNPQSPHGFHLSKI